MSVRHALVKQAIEPVLQTADAKLAAAGEGLPLLVVRAPEPRFWSANVEIPISRSEGVTARLLEHAGPCAVPPHETHPTERIFTPHSRFPSVSIPLDAGVAEALARAEAVMAELVADRRRFLEQTIAGFGERLGSGDVVVLLELHPPHLLRDREEIDYRTGRPALNLNWNSYEGFAAVPREVAKALAQDRAPR